MNSETLSDQTSDQWWAVAARALSAQKLISDTPQKPARLRSSA